MNDGKERERESERRERRSRVDTYHCQLHAGGCSSSSNTLLYKVYLNICGDVMLT